MRNNVLLWLTGWSFSTFSQFHRWTARITTIHAILHSIAYTVEAFLGTFPQANVGEIEENSNVIPPDGGKEEYYADWEERYWWCGVIVSRFLLPQPGPHYLTKQTSNREQLR